MKIIINAYQYSENLTGTDRMAFNFLKEMQKIDSKNTYYIICSHEKYIPKIIVNKNFKIIKPARLYGHKFTQRFFNKAWRSFLPIILTLYKADVYFSFHNMRIPRFRLARIVIASNLDLVPVKLKEYARFKPKLNKEILRTVNKADHFVSISEFSKKELCDTFNVAPEKIHVIHLAPDPLFSEFNNQKNQNLPKKFILTIGGAEPRKNVNTVIKAFLSLPEKIRYEYPLYIVGGNWHDQKIENFTKDTNIHNLGFVEDKKLALLYKKCTVFIFASEYEGFGFSILEAMKSGAPVISAKGSSLDEVSNGAALMFNSENNSDLTQKIINLINDETLQKNLIEKGYSQSKKFSWQKAAKKLYTLLTKDG